MIFPKEISENIISGKDCIVFCSEPPEVNPGKRVPAQRGGGDVSCPGKVFRQAVGRPGGQGKAGARDRRRRTGARGP